MDIALLLDMAAEGYGGRCLVGRRADGLTARELQALSVNGASAISAAGATALLYLDVTGPAFAAALFAAARAGVPLVPLNYRLGAGQLRRLVAMTPGAIAIADPHFHTLLGECGVPAVTSQQWLGGSLSLARVPAAERHDAAVIIYTSGTTSEPKGVLLRHLHLCSYVLGTVEFGSASPDDSALVSLPPYHIAAVANVLTNVFAGRRVIVLEQFSARQWLDLVREESVTHALVVPTMLSRILSEGHDTAVPSLRSLAYGGATMPLALIERGLTIWPDVDFVNAYGLTETSSTISVLGPSEHRAAVASDDPAVRARLVSAGLPLPQVQVEIRDPAGSVVPNGVAGRIWVRGEQVSGEYVDHGPQLDARRFFDTRDEGHLDADGYLFVRGRSDDTIIRGGENIAPAEIESILLEHADIADAAVVGVPDTEWGQRLEAVVVPLPGRTVDPEDVRHFALTRLRGSKTPERVVVWTELPRTDAGKLIRRLVADKLLKPVSDES
jgi:acyl-CoA synthetase (AMP-forming)/AMP-acid ligase II